MLLGPAKPRFPSLQNQSGHVFIAGIWQGSTGKHLWGNSQRPAHRVQPGTLLPFPPWFPWRMMGLGVQSWKSLWSMSVLPSSSHNSPFYHIPGSWEIQARLECRLTTSWSGLSSVDSSYCQKVLLGANSCLSLLSARVEFWHLKATVKTTGTFCSYHALAYEVSRHYQISSSRQPVRSYCRPHFMPKETEALSDYATY